ncbi:MAG: hypothetical protein ABIX28_14330 [Vicinamibacterales bacterium]
MSNAGKSLSRRRFFDLAAGVAGAAVASGRLAAQSASRAPSDKVRIALVGSGSRGRSVAALFLRSHAEVRYVAACDAYKTRLDQGIQQLSELQTGVKPDGVEDYRRILDRKDVDAIHIATGTTSLVPAAAC